MIQYKKEKTGNKWICSAKSSVENVGNIIFARSLDRIARRALNCMSVGDKSL